MVLFLLAHFYQSEFFMFMWYEQLRTLLLNPLYISFGGCDAQSGPCYRVLEAVSARDNLAEANLLRFLLRFVIIFEDAHHARAGARVDCAALVRLKVFECGVVVNFKQHSEFLEICYQRICLAEVE